MKECWSNYFKMGIVHFMAFPGTLKGEGPVLETIQRIAEDDFFDIIEVGIMKNSETRKKARHIIETAHMEVGFGGQPGLLTGQHDLNSLDEGVRKKAIDRCKQSVDEAVELGAKRAAFLSGKDPGDKDREKALSLLVDSLCQISDYARSKGLEGITLEAFDSTIDKKCLIGPSDIAVKLSKAVRDKGHDFGLMWDLSHVPILFEDMEKALETVKDHLIHIHIGNALHKDTSDVAYGDKHPRFGYPGGENDVPQLTAFLKTLFKIGYLGEGKRPVVTFEVMPMGEETSELVIANAKRTLKAAWAEV